MRRPTLLSLAAILSIGLAACAPKPEAEPEAMAAAAPEVILNVPLSTESEEARQHLIEGVRASDLGRLEEAEEHMQAVIAADPEFALGHLGAGVSSNSVEEFAAHLEAAVEKSANASDAERLWIETYQKGFASDFEGRLAKAEEFAALAPDSPRAWMEVAVSQALLARYEESRATAVKVAEMHPSFIPAYTQLVNSYLFNEPKDFAKAEEYARKIVELEPEEQNSHDLLGDVHRAQGNFEEAHTAYTRAAELAPDNGSPLQQRGHVNSFLGNYDEARADYQKAMELSDDDIAATYGVWKALVPLHAGDPKAAIDELNGLVGAIDGMEIAKPGTAKIFALNEVMTIATHHGMAEAAGDAIERCRVLMEERAAEVGKDEFRRNQQAQLTYREGMLAARTGDYGAATAKAEEFMQLVEPNTDPNKNQPAHEVLGLASLLQGDYETAVAHYEQTDPADIYARYHHALALEGAGRAEEARPIFDEVARHNFNFAGYALIREKAMAKAAG